MLSIILYSTCIVQILYKLYSLQLNCTYSNYTQTAATCSAVQQHSAFTVQILYKQYSLQLNCTYSNYTQTAATCSAVQQHSIFTVQILYSLQLNCTYSNYTQSATTCSATQQHKSCQLMSSVVLSSRLFNVVSMQTIISSDHMLLTKSHKWTPTTSHNYKTQAEYFVRRAYLANSSFGCDDAIQKGARFWITSSHHLRSRHLGSVIPQDASGKRSAPQFLLYVSSCPLLPPFSAIYWR
jgi:hypothetical protein